MVYFIREQNRNLIVGRVTKLKKYNLDFINDQKNIELDKDLYKLVAVTLLECFIEDKIKNCTLLDNENEQLQLLKKYY